MIQNLLGILIWDQSIRAWQIDPHKLKNDELKFTFDVNFHSVDYEYLSTKPLYKFAIIRTFKQILLCDSLCKSITINDIKVDEIKESVTRLFQ